MAADQEWCLECGAARTIIARPPDWRIPVLVIGVVVLLVAGGFAYAISQLGSNAGRITVLNPGTPAKTASAPTIYSWTPGLDGYTVILDSESSRAAADAQATKLAAHLPDIGVLFTSQHHAMSPSGRWDVFQGRDASYAQARAAATQADHSGLAGAEPVLVGRPGQS